MISVIKFNMHIICNVFTKIVFLQPEYVIFYTFSTNKARQIISMGGVDRDLIFRLNVINRINILDQLAHVSLYNFNDGINENHSCNGRYGELELYLL